MTDPDTPPSTPPPTVPPPEPPTTPPTNPPPGPGAPPEPPPLSDGAAPGAYGAAAGAYNAPATGPSPGSPYANGPAVASPYASGVATPPQTLSLTSFIVGLASLVFFWVPGLGFLAAVAAIVIGFIARRKEPAAPKWMWLVGIISGFAAALLSVLFLVPFLLFLAFGSVTTNIPIPSA